MIGEYDSSGNAIREYVYLGGQPIALFSDEKPDEVLQIHTDHLGTPRAVSNSNNEILWRWEGDAFGTNSPSVETVTMPLRMAGQYADNETGLFYNYFRFYDPKTGRYVTSDPIGLEGGTNTYGYVNALPLKYIDKFGLDASLYPKDPSMADPSDYVIEKDESNGYGQSCDNSCQTIRYTQTFKTIQDADRANRNSLIVGVATGIILTSTTGYCVGPSGFGILGSLGSNSVSGAVGTSFSFWSAFNQNFVYPGDKMIVEYKVCCGSSNGSGNNIEQPKITIVRASK